MQLVGSHQFFCFLGNLPLRRRKKLRADRRVQHIQQCIPQPFLSAGIRVIADQMTDQGLWHRDIDGIHGHMIPVIGGPSESQLGKIPCSNDQAAALIGQIHQDLCSLPGLRVFIRDIMRVAVLPDVAEVNRHCVFNAYLAKRGSQFFRQSARIVVGPVRGTEPGHGDRQDILSRNAQHVKGPCRHQQGKCRIQTAGNADNRMSALRMLQSFPQTERLNIQNLITALFP